MIASKTNPLKKVHFNSQITHSLVTTPIVEPVKPPKAGSHVQETHTNPMHGKESIKLHLKPTTKPVKIPVPKKLHSEHVIKPSQLTELSQLEQLLEQKRSLQKAIQVQRQKNNSIRQSISSNERIYTMKLQATRREIDVLKSKYQEYQKEIKQLEIQALNLGF